MSNEDPGNLFGVPLPSGSINAARGQLLDAINQGTLFGKGETIEYVSTGNDPWDTPDRVRAVLLTIILVFIGTMLIVGFNQPKEFDNVTEVKVPYQFPNFYTTVVARSYTKKGDVKASYTIFSSIPANAVYDMKAYNECMAAWNFDKAYKASSCPLMFESAYYRQDEFSYPPR